MIEVTYGSHWPRKEILCTVDEFVQYMEKESPGIPFHGNTAEERVENYIIDTGYAQYFAPKVFDSFISRMMHAAEVNGIGGLMPTRIFENEVEEMIWYAKHKA